MKSNLERPVDKIGGFSMGQPTNAIDTVHSTDETGRVVVVSAPGGDVVGHKPSRMTEMLKVFEADPTRTNLAPIRARLGEIARRGDLSEDYITEQDYRAVADIETAMRLGTPVDPLGETWMAHSFAEMLGPDWDYAPSTELLFFHPDGSIDEEATRRAVRDRLNPRRNYITDGNQGQGPDGLMMRIGDGGSDVSGAYFRQALGLGILRIHSNVDGYKTADPNIKVHGTPIPHIQEVSEVTFAEGGHMYVTGNGLVHGRVTDILDQSGSNVLLYDTRTGRSGTTMGDTRDNIDEQPIVGVVGDEDVIKVVWRKRGSEDQAGTTIPFREELARLGVPINKTTTDDNMEAISTGHEHLEDLREGFADSSEVTIEDTWSSITVVGEGMLIENGPKRRNRVMLGVALALDHHNIPLGSVTGDGIGLSVFVPREHFRSALAAIHGNVIETH